MKKILFMLVTALFACASFVSAQPRPIEKTETKPTTPVRPAPASFDAKYEGGLFGFTKKMEGTLKFDDDNERLVFFDKYQKEKFGIPYKSVLIVSPQSQSVQSTTGKVVGAVFSNIVGGFIKEKRRYMIINFDDPDVEAKGVVNFKIDDKDLLDSVIAALGYKAELKQRGDAYYRPRKVSVTDDGK
jgi:hypothetical protein